MLSRLFQRKPKVEVPKATGITVFLLQNHLVRFTEEQLNSAMQSAWRRSYDSTTFYASTLDDDNALFKVGAVFYPLQHEDHRLTAEELGKCEVPVWADHAAKTKFLAHFPGGIPSDMAPLFYGFVGLLLSQLASPNTKAFFYQEAGIFLPASPEIVARLSEGVECLPAQVLGSKS